MGRGFNVGRVPSGTAPNTLVVSPTAGQTFKRGALVVLDANGTLVECGADPTKVLGVAGADAFTGYGYQAANNPSPITGQGEKNAGVPVMLADRTQEFTCRGINGGTDPLTPTLAMRGVAYGVAKVGDDWVLDQADTTNDVVIVVDIIPDAKIFVVKFVEAVLNLP